MGTILRIADWFGIQYIFCSLTSADVYNPKTVQATMGAIARVKVIYTALSELLRSLPDDYPVYGTFLEGKDIYNEQLTAHGLIIMGNEGNGIGQEIAQFVNRRLYIPSYPPDRKTSESLNVAIATAITCAEFRRLLK
jgi:TrmH family RNA methyltransferase